MAIAVSSSWANSSSSSAVVLLAGWGGVLAKVGAGGTAPAATPDPASDILNALLALGYNEREALGAMKVLPADVSVSDGIRLALKNLAKA